MARKSVLLKYVLIFFLLGLGVVIGIIVHNYWKLPVEETVNLMDLVTLVTTIFLAVYIPEVLDRKLQVSRDKKELIEQRIEELQVLYRRINVLVQSSDEPKPKDALVVKNTLDICQHRLDTIITLLKYSKMKVSFDNDIRKIQEFCDVHRELLWVEDTGSKAVTYPADTKEKEETLYNRIDKETCLLVFKISEA